MRSFHATGCEKNHPLAPSVSYWKSCPALTMHILWVLSTNGPTRFGGYADRWEGIFFASAEERLRVLEPKGIRLRDYEPTIPPSVTYGITKRMKDISKVMGDLDELARNGGSKRRPRAHEAGGR